MKIVDRFHILRRATEQVNRSRANNLLSSTGRVIMESFMAELEQVQPSGDETFVDERSSTRRGYTPIASGWKPVRITSTDDGVSLSLESTSRHINWQRLGTKTKDYSIPSLPTGVSFWWGAPLPWAPTEVPELAAMAPGMFLFDLIIHPGIKPYGGEDFVKRAWNEIQAQAAERFGETAKTILFQPFRDMR